MGFHPHMYARVTGFDLMEPLSTLAFDQMTVDFWRVAAQAGARGRYVSMHPRVVILFDGAALSLYEKGHAPQRAVGFFIPAGVEVWSRAEQPGALAHLDIHISRKALGALPGKAADITRPILLQELGSVAPLAELLARECERPGRDRRHAERLAHLILLEMLHSAGPLPAARGSGLPDWLGAVRAHVLANLRDKLSVDRLAEVAGMSRSSFNRHIREALNTAPYHWVLELRCAQAQRLMAQEMPLAEVAMLCGFSDQAHFNRVFKAVTGRTPTLWRQEAARPALDDWAN